VEATGLAVSGNASDIDRGVIRGGIFTTYVYLSIEFIYRTNHLLYYSATEFPEISMEILPLSAYLRNQTRATLPH